MYNVTITFNVNGQIISRNEKDTTLLSDSIDLIKARFNFSPEWQGYTKTAIFKSSTKKPYSRILVDDVCMVPPEAIKKSKYMSVSVFGVSGTQLITATDQIVPLTPSGYTDDSIVSPAPTENIYQQIVTLMQRQAVDAVHAETAQRKAEQAERTAKSHAEQTDEDRIATGEDRVATGADRSAVNTALTGFAETTLPDAIQAVEDKANTEIARVGQASDTQVQAVNAAGAEQIGLATEQADRAETAQRNSETAANTATQKASEAAQHDILTQTELTDEQQSLARRNINAAKVNGTYELIETITLTEAVNAVERTTEPDGTPYAFKSVYITMKAIAPSASYQPRLWAMYNDKYLNGKASTSGNISTEYDSYCTSITELINGMWQNKSVTPQKGNTWTGVLCASVGYNPILEVDAPICNRVVIQKSSLLAWEIGCVFKIYGVRA